MAYFDADDVEKFFRYFSQYLDSNVSNNTMNNIATQLRRHFVNAFTKSEEYFDIKASKLIDRITDNKYTEGGVIIILKNKNDLFNIYAFAEEVEFSLINLVSSEAFEDHLKRNPVSGHVIENVLSEDILVFLKAYYLYRKDPIQSQTSQNPSFEYNYKSFEMASIDEKFNEDKLDQKIALNYIVLYDKEALPYSLGYLDNYKQNLFSHHTGERFYNFSYVIREVRSNRYLGTCLNRIK